MTRRDPNSADTAPLETIDLSLRALEVFSAVVETGSMANAAERLKASRSTISQQISNLEKALGAILIDRSARPIALTPAGQVLRRHASRILEAVAEARTELTELGLSTLSHLRLGIIDDLDAILSSEIVASLHSHYPACSFRASSGWSHVLTEALVRREADIVLTASMPEDTDPFDIFPILREPFVMAVTRGKIPDIASKTPAQIRQDVMTLPFVGYATSLPMGRLIAQHLRRNRLTPQQLFTFEASRSVLAMVRQCGGWAITTPLSVLDSERFRDDIEFHPLPMPGLSRSVHLIARQGELGHMPARLADLCRELVGTKLLPQAREWMPFIEPGFHVTDDFPADVSSVA